LIRIGSALALTRREQIGHAAHQPPRKPRLPH
jgi:hypothetical protein